MRIPPDLQELIDRTAQDDGITRQKKLAAIIEFYFSDRGEQERSASLRSASLESSLESLKDSYSKLYDEHEWLKGEFAILSTKLLPAAEKTMTPWYVRLKRRFRGEKRKP